MSNPVGRPVDPKSKLSKAKRLFDGRRKRSEMVKIFMKRLKLTPAGASTYHQICKAA